MVERKNLTTKFEEYYCI